MDTDLIDPKLFNFVKAVFQLLFNFGVFIFIAIIIFFVIKYYFSGGDAKEIENIKRKVPYILIGFSLLFLFSTIPYIIRLFFK